MENLDTAVVEVAEEVAKEPMNNKVIMALTAGAVIAGTVVTVKAINHFKNKKALAESDELHAVVEQPIVDESEDQ